MLKKDKKMFLYMIMLRMKPVIFLVLVSSIYMNYYQEIGHHNKYNAIRDWVKHV